MSKTPTLSEVHRALNVPNNGADATADMLAMGQEQLNIEPGRGFLHVEQCDPTRTASGLHIPDAAQGGQLPRYRVLAVGACLLGPTGDDVPSLYSVGDTVLVNGSGQMGMVAKLPQHGQALIQETTVLAKVAT